MSSIRPPRGTHDLIGEQARLHTRVVSAARDICATYGFDEWSTPIFEDTRVFLRSLGETSDVVTKEMYSFLDRGGDSLTLRPEGTAAICRALVSNALTQKLPQRVFYTGPMFRYERPQKGRFRQFHQIGAEFLGVSDPLFDAEVIAMGYEVLRDLGVSDAVMLEINTLGDIESRKAWREALVVYFRQYRDALSEESQARLETNPLRILDSKSSADRALLDDAPSLSTFLNRESMVVWDRVRHGLDLYGIPYRENRNIVRGLDYYSHTAFEFVTEQLGAQGTVLAGGRYEGLIAQMGGPDIAAIGWAGGVERLALLMADQRSLAKRVVVLTADEQPDSFVIEVLQALRACGVRAELSFQGAFRKRLERALKSGADFAVFIGDDEKKRGVVVLRDLTLRAQRDVSLAELISFMREGA